MCLMPPKVNDNCDATDKTEVATTLVNFGIADKLVRT